MRFRPGCALASITLEAQSNLANRVGPSDRRGGDWEEISRLATMRHFSSPSIALLKCNGDATVLLSCRRILLLAPRSHRRRYSIATDSPRATLQRSIGLFNRDDEDFCTRLEIALVARHVNNNGRIGGDKDFLFSVLIFQRQRLP